MCMAFRAARALRSDIQAELESILIAIGLCPAYYEYPYVNYGLA